MKRSAYLQVVGLLALSQKHVQAIHDIELALCELVGEEPDGMGHVGDAIYNNYTADKLIEKVAARNKIKAKEKKK